MVRVSEDIFTEKTFSKIIKEHENRAVYNYHRLYLYLCRDTSLWSYRSKEYKYLFVMFFPEFDGRNSNNNWLINLLRCDLLLYKQIPYGFIFWLKELLSVWLYDWVSVKSFQIRLLRDINWLKFSLSSGIRNLKSFVKFRFNGYQKRAGKVSRIHLFQDRWAEEKITFLFLGISASGLVFFCIPFF